MVSKRLFPGGVHPKEGKNGKAVNSKNAIVDLPVPPRVIIPLSQHIGAPAKATVNAGDHVRIGQVIGEACGFVSAPVHASVAGTVVGVEEALLANGTTTPAVVINNDYSEEWVELTPCDHPESLSAAELQQIIRNAGIVGLGGATFPTAVKLTPSQGKTIDTLILNGAECEPYLTADHRLMLENAKEVVDGLWLMMKALDVKKGFIGIEMNKPDAISAIRKAANGKGIEVRPLPVRYPQGGEKQLIYAITKRTVPCGGLPLDVGVVVCNVGTSFAVSQAVRLGRPLIDRITTVGGAVEKPGNFRVRIGSTIDNLIDFCGGFTPDVRQLVYGGPMMGAAIARTDIPVTKGCSGITALDKAAMEPKESACIRCGKCMRACPMKLAPAKIDSLVRLGNIEGAEKAGAMNCLECGACTYVCPAKRSLTQSCRTGKKIITARRKAAQAKAKAEEAAEKAKQEAKAAEAKKEE